MSDDLKEEIETLQSVYNDDELAIKSQANGSLHIIYTAKLEKTTEINVDFSVINECSISVTNAEDTQKIIPPEILTQIESVLTEKYKQEIDSMPIFQCILFCNDEIFDDERLNLSQELNKIKKRKPKIDENAFWPEVIQKYRQDFKKNGGGFLLQHAYMTHSHNAKFSEDEKVNIDNDYISKDVRNLLYRNQQLWAAIPGIQTVQRILEKKYNVKEFEIKFIASIKNIKKFLNNGGKWNEFQIVFHGTNSHNDNSIIENGLIVGGTKGVSIAHGAAYGKGVYCSPSLDTAGCYMRGSMFICLVRSHQCKKSGNVFVVPNDKDILPIYLSSFSYHDIDNYNSAYMNKIKWMANLNKKKKASLKK